MGLEVMGKGLKGLGMELLEMELIRLVLEWLGKMEQGLVTFHFVSLGKIGLKLSELQLMGRELMGLCLYLIWPKMVEHGLQQKLELELLVLILKMRRQ